MYHWQTLKCCFKVFLLYQNLRILFHLRVFSVGKKSIGQIRHKFSYVESYPSHFLSILRDLSLPLPSFLSLHHHPRLPTTSRPSRCFSLLLFLVICFFVLVSSVSLPTQMEEIIFSLSLKVVEYIFHNHIEMDWG